MHEATVQEMAKRATSRLRDNVFIVRRAIQGQDSALFDCVRYTSLSFHNPENPVTNNRVLFDSYTEAYA